MKAMKKISLGILVLFAISCLLIAYSASASEYDEEGEIANLLLGTDDLIADNNTGITLYGNNLAITLICITDSPNCNDVIYQLDNRLQRLGFTTNPTNATKIIMIYAGFNSDNLNKPTGKTEETILMKSEKDFKWFAYGKKTVEDIIAELGIISPDPPAEEPTEDIFSNDIRT